MYGGKFSPHSRRPHPILYLFALLAPPFALLSCGEIFQYIESLLIEAVAILLAFMFFPVGVVVHLVAVVHGVVVVHGHHADTAAR